MTIHQVPIERPLFTSSPGQTESEDANQLDASVNMRLKGTFIEVEADDGSEAPPSPRALSDPGSEVSSSYSSHFAKERLYVAELSHKLSRTLSQRKSERSKNQSRSGNSADHSDSAQCTIGYESSEEASVKRGTDGAVMNAMNNMGKNICGTPTNRFRGYAPSSNSSDISRDKAVGKYEAERTVSTPNVNLNRDDLRNRVHKKTAEINEVLQYERISTALTSINEIPERVEAAFQQSKLHWMDDFKPEVSAACSLVANSEVLTPQILGSPEDGVSTAERAAQSMTMIPDMIMASFENSFAKAMTIVRVRVDDVIQELEGCDMAKDQVVAQMWAIPQEVRQITHDAVKEASQQSREMVVEQLDCVLQSFTEETMPDALLQAKRQIVANVPKKLPDTLRAATEAAESNVCQAVKFVEAKCDVAGVVANRVVADTLLRAKVGDRGPVLQKLKKDEKEEVSGLETLRLCNPGSIGHPELCSRACLYYPLGKCSNGANCAFCHAPHSKRATHLDKRHREMLRDMDFADRFCYIAPVLRTKLQALEVGPEVMEKLDRLSEFVGPPSIMAQASEPDGYKVRGKETRTLQVALRFMSLRSLLTLLHHAPVPAGAQHSAAVEALMQSIRSVSRPPKQSSEERSSQKNNRQSRTTQSPRTRSNTSDND